jgi:DNA polymerase III subunit epsilon
MDEAPFAFVDLEMTGLRPERDRVIEACAVRVRGGEVEASLATLVRPECGTFGNERVHGISEESLQSAPTFREIEPSLWAILDGAILVAHGASWDIAFLRAEWERLGIARPLEHHLDTLTLSRRVFAFPSHSLSALCKELGIERARSHRAEDDVRALRELFERVVGELAPSTPRDLWHVRIGEKAARPEILDAALRAQEAGQPVLVRYRPARRKAEELQFVITSVTTRLDPPRVLGYLLPGRGRRELRADRILAIEAQGPDDTDA